MILGEDGQKLSKRHGAVSVMQYDEDGYLPEAVLNYLARLGWSHGDDEMFDMRAVRRVVRSRAHHAARRRSSTLQGFSAAYSEFDMHLQMVTAADAPVCQDAQCVADRAFDQRVIALGRRLAVSAFHLHADLYLRFPRFEFIVADKAEPGAASSAGGTVIVYRELQRMSLDDAVLAFIWRGKCAISSPAIMTRMSLRAYWSRWRRN
jgi:hypothetical protein